LIGSIKFIPNKSTSSYCELEKNKVLNYKLNFTTGKFDSKNKGILLGSFSGLLLKLVSLGVNLISIPLTVNYLGREKFGVWMIFSSILILLNHTDFGIGNGLTSSLTKLNKEDILEKKKLISSTFIFLTFISSIILCITFVIHKNYDYVDFFKIQNPETAKQLELSLLILLIFFIINLPLSISQKIYEADQKLYVHQYHQIIGSIIGLLGVIIAIKLDLNLVGIVFAYYIGVLFINIISSIRLLASYGKEIIPSFKSFDYLKLKYLLKPGIIFFGLSLATVLSNSLDGIIIGKLLNVEEIGLYEIVKRIFLYASLTQVMIYPLWPALSKAFHNYEFVWLKKTVLKMIFTATSLTIIITLPLVFWGTNLINFWTGENFEIPTGLIFGFFTFGVFSVYGGIMSSFMNITNKLLLQQLILVCVVSILALLLKITLIPKYGITAAIWSSVLPNLAIFLPATILIFKKNTKKYVI